MLFAMTDWVSMLFPNVPELPELPELPEPDVC